MKFLRFLSSFLSEPEKIPDYSNEINKMFEEKDVDGLIRLLGIEKLDFGTVGMIELRLALLGDIALKPLVQAVEGKNYLLSRRAIQAITELGPVGLDTLIKGLNHHHPEVREASARGIYSLCTSRDFLSPDGHSRITIRSDDLSKTIGPLIRALNDDYFGVRRYAVRSLKEFKDSRVWLPLVNDPRVIKPLQKLYVKEMITAAQCGKSPSLYLISDIKSALKGFKGTSDFPTLLQQSWIRQDLKICNIKSVKYDESGWIKSIEYFTHDPKQEERNAHEAHSAAQKGAAYEKKEQWYLAIEQYIKSIELVPGNDPSLSLYHTNLGICYTKVGKIDDSIRELEIALQLDPNNERAFLNLEGVKLLR
jgi:hypothetical protein